jgi:hypothetical protein
VLLKLIVVKVEAQTASCFRGEDLTDMRPRCPLLMHGSEALFF